MLVDLARSLVPPGAQPRHDDYESPYRDPLALDGLGREFSARAIRNLERTRESCAPQWHATARPKRVGGPHRTQIMHQCQRILI